MPVALLPIAVSKLAVANPMPCVAPVIAATLASRTFRQGGGLLGALGAPGALRLVESRYPLGYCAANTPLPVFSCPANKAPFAAFSMS
jgi:hypothetical protein